MNTLLGKSLAFKKEGRFISYHLNTIYLLYVYGYLHLNYKLGNQLNNIFCDLTFTSYWKHFAPQKTVCECQLHSDVSACEKLLGWCEGG